MAQTDINIAGVGGQGSILAGVILGTAAVTYDKQVCRADPGLFIRTAGADLPRPG